MLRTWLKMLPMFAVEWIARRYCSRQRIGSWTYVQPFGPGTHQSPVANVFFEFDVSDRDWFDCIESFDCNAGDHSDACPAAGKPQGEIAVRRRIHQNRDAVGDMDAKSMMFSVLVSYARGNTSEGMAAKILGVDRIEVRERLVQALDNAAKLDARFRKDGRTVAEDAEEEMRF